MVSGHLSTNTGINSAKVPRCLIDGLVAMYNRELTNAKFRLGRGHTLQDAIYIIISWWLNAPPPRDNNLFFLFFLLLLESRRNWPSGLPERVLSTV